MWKNKKIELTNTEVAVIREKIMNSDDKNIVLLNRVTDEQIMELAYIARKYPAELSDEFGAMFTR